MTSTLHPQRVRVTDIDVNILKPSGFFTYHQLNKNKLLVHMYVVTNTTIFLMLRLL